MSGGCAVCGVATCRVVACRYWLCVGLVHGFCCCVPALFLCVFLGVSKPPVPVVVRVARGLFLCGVLVGVCLGFRWCFGVGCLV